MTTKAAEAPLRIEAGTVDDVPEILRMIRGLAKYERLEHEVVATEAGLRESLFGQQPAGEVVLARVGSETVGFALLFHNYSTFLGKRGLYLEDLFIREEYRSRGYGRQLLAYLARLAMERDCGRFEWWVLDWNEPAHRFYESIGARPEDGWTTWRVDGDALDALADAAPT